MNHTRLITNLFLLLILCVVFGFAKAEESGKKYQQEEQVIVYETPFDKMMAVMLHKRCVNCHPAGNVPLQGEDSHLHHFQVVRGENDHGLIGYGCKTCHTNENNDFSGVPGAPHWGLAPASMAWEGKTRIEIAHQIMNPEKNGGKSPDDILKHLTEDALVLWAWDPGVDAEGVEREKPPVPKEEFIEAVKTWIANGAKIPEQ